MLSHKLILCLLLAGLVTLLGCHQAPRVLEPALPAPVFSPPSPCGLSFTRSPFPALTAEEASSPWGRELRIGYQFARGGDLYQAITAFKRALFLLPPEEAVRRQECDYAIVLSYYLGEQYADAVGWVEASSLTEVTPDFPVYDDLLLVLYDCYTHLGEESPACVLLEKIRACHPATAHRLEILSALQTADFSYLCCEAETCPSHTYFGPILAGYTQRAKSVATAEKLNALLPGAGYWYVGQQQTAITALLVNALFLWATYYFFDSGNIPAALITLSLEGGWYCGGIYGGGLAAKRYNEHLYCQYAQKITQREKLFPLLQLHYTF